MLTLTVLLLLVLSLPTRGAWIEIGLSVGINELRLASLPTRGAWIEIDIPYAGSTGLFVAPHTGSVD